MASGKTKILQFAFKNDVIFFKQVFESFKFSVFSDIEPEYMSLRCYRVYDKFTQTLFVRSVCVHFNMYTHKKLDKIIARINLIVELSINKKHKYECFYI